MLRTFMHAKLHHARVTDANPDYVGSVAIGAELLAACGIEDGEQIHVWAVDHGARIVTYAITGAHGEIVVNGGGAHHFKVGDRVIIAAFGLSETRPDQRVIVLDEQNCPSVLITGESPTVLVEG